MEELGRGLDVSSDSLELMAGELRRSISPQLRCVNVITLFALNISQSDLSNASS